MHITMYVFQMFQHDFVEKNWRFSIQRILNDYHYDYDIFQLPQHDSIEKIMKSAI